MLCVAMLTPAKEPPCDCPPKGHCVVECVTKKVTHPAYSSKCTEYCLPKRSFLKTLMCQGDDALCCGEPHYKRVLVKKPCTEEKCVKQCVLKPCETPPAVLPAAGVDAKK